MFRYSRPTLLRRTIHEVPFGMLLASGIRLVAIDVDNTLTLQGSKALDEPTRALLASLTTKGVEVWLASNSRRDLVPMADSFGGAVHQPGHGVPRKPSLGYFQAILDQTGLAAEQVVMIGDKYFFDANPPLKLGMKSVLLNPLGNDLIGDRLMAIRFWEALALRHIGINRPHNMRPE